jgi:hypothetical protein
MGREVTINIKLQVRCARVLSVLLVFQRINFSLFFFSTLEFELRVSRLIGRRSIT